LTDFFQNNSLPSTNTDEYKNAAVELTGWGAKERDGVASDKLKRIAIKVFSMRYF
jgi:hypothetical protein